MNLSRANIIQMVVRGVLCVGVLVFLILSMVFENSDRKFLIIALGINAIAVVMNLVFARLNSKRED